MAGNRKGRGQQSHHQNRSNGKASSNAQPTANLSKQQQQQLKVDMQVQELHEMLEEQKPTSSKLCSSWNELAVAGLVLLALGLLSVIVGVAAGMTISIHYFEDPVHRLDRNGMVITSQHKVTTYENDMVSTNIMTLSSSLDLGRVEKTFYRGERAVLSVVRAGANLEEATNDDDKEPFRDIFYTPVSIEETLCPDGLHYGFSDWQTLKEAVREANALSAERFLRWNEYFSSIESHEFGAFNDDSLYYEPDFHFTICYGLTLYARKGPIFINSENIHIECEGCTLHVGGTHFSFGPHARGAFMGGITFKGAQTSSLTFHYDGADATFEDCTWISSSSSTATFGPVADVNSTRYVLLLLLLRLLFFAAYWMGLYITTASTLPNTPRCHILDIQCACLSSMRYSRFKNVKI
jgi:hypothetical protein